MTYAPVIITTLNRFDHFCQCLESLEANTGADKTDVYVGLDYPPSEKYVDGWKKIGIYLREKENKHKFKNLIILRRDHNCGVNNSMSNMTLLIKEVSAKYDRLIASEDDNVFSPNFLQYINQGLDMYEHDANCEAICGYNYYGVNIPVSNNVYKSREFSAWGVGYWTKKSPDFMSCCNEVYLKNIMGSWQNIWKIYKYEPRLLNTILLNIDSHVVFGDTMRVCYQYLNDKYSLFPVVSKVRNIGFDNSGTTIFKVDNNYIEQEIDKNEDFIMDKIEGGVLWDVQKAISLFFGRSFFMNSIILFRVLCYKLTGKDILYYEAKRRNPSLFK